MSNTNIVEQFDNNMSSVATAV